MSAPSVPAARQRNVGLDGLRGVAIVLVVLSHGWILHDYATADRSIWWRLFLRNGNAAVTVFLVAAGYLSFRALERSGDLVAMRPVAQLVRKVVRVGPVLWALLVAVVLVKVLDRTDPNSWSITRDSVLRVLTYTYNWLIQDDIGSTRPDLGHLWFLSVEMQAFLLITALAYLLRRRRALLLGVLGALFVVLVLWRFHSYATENVFMAFNRTTTRMDAFVVGTAVAVAAPLVPWDRPPGRTLAPALALLMVPVLLWCSTGAHFMRWGGTALELLVGFFVLLTTRDGAPAVPGLSHPALVRLGRESLVIYIWHFPVLWFVERHLQHERWPLVALVALAVTAALCVASTRWIEGPVARFLSRPAWDRVLRDGLVAGLRPRTAARP